MTLDARWSRTEQISAAAPSPSSLHPWLEELVGLGWREIEAFTPCDNCGVGTWAFYGRWALCIRCANLGRAR